MPDRRRTRNDLRDSSLLHVLAAATSRQGLLSFWWRVLCKYSVRLISFNMGIYYKKKRPFNRIFGSDRISRAWYRGFAAGVGGYTLKRLQATSFAFAAILEDGSVVTWGSADHGGDSSAVRGQLKGVQQIQATTEAFAAILKDGSAVTWGDVDDGADSSAVRDEVCSRFKPEDGSVVVGNSSSGSAQGCLVLLVDFWCLSIKIEPLNFSVCFLSLKIANRIFQHFPIFADPNDLIHGPCENDHTKHRRRLKTGCSEDSPRFSTQLHIGIYTL